MKILRDFKNNLLKRKEIRAEMDAVSNPGLAAVSKLVAEHFKTDEKQIVVKRIGSEFGENRFVIDAFIYDSAEVKAKVEPKTKVKKVEGAAAPVPVLAAVGGAK